MPPEHRVKRATLLKACKVYIVPTSSRVSCSEHSRRSGASARAFPCACAGPGMRRALARCAGVTASLIMWHLISSADLPHLYLSFASLSEVGECTCLRAVLRFRASRLARSLAARRMSDCNVSSACCPQQRSLGRVMRICSFALVRKCENCWSRQSSRMCAGAAMNGATSGTAAAGTSAQRHGGGRGAHAPLFPVPVARPSPWHHVYLP